ncbi:hypothetical protein MMC22_008395 [Lobaria immixta]|nr:hypothetical protein [Lobaria immixta]
MDQASTGTQSPNEAQIPSGLRSSTETSASPEPRSLSNVRTMRTPLGEPMDQVSISSRTEDPVKWHMNYWNSLWSVAVANGEDGILTALRIEYAISKKYTISKIRNKELFNKVLPLWFERQDFIERENQHRLSPTNDLFRPQMNSEEQKRLSRDVERMLVDKEWKMRSYLIHMETLMQECFAAGNCPIACEPREKIRDLYHRIRKRLRVLYERLNEEEKAETRLDKEKRQPKDPANITADDISRLMSVASEDQDPKEVRLKVLSFELTGHLIRTAKCLWSHRGVVDTWYFYMARNMLRNEESLL